MAKFSSKHKDREKTFQFKSFQDGLDKETSPTRLPITALTLCKNMKYKIVKDTEGNPVVVLVKRQGTKKLTSTALSSAAVKACTYYLAGAQYIVATASKVYYLTAAGVPTEIGDIEGIPTFTEFKGKLIIHDGGVTKAWNGTTFETLTCLYQDENIGTGDGSTVTFTGTLENPAVTASSISITYNGSTNLLTNGGFDSATTGWTAVDSTLASTTGGSAGNCLTITRTGGTYQDAYQDVTGLTVGTIYQWSAYVKSGTSGNEAAIVGIYYDSAWLSSVSGDTTSSWVRRTGTFIAQETTHRFYLRKNTATAGTMLFDSATLFSIGTDTDLEITDDGAGNLTGDCSAGTIDYTTGVYSFTCDTAPDNTTEILAEYEHVAGAPKSKAGFVRASRLYAWGDSDNPSRMWYCGPNDEDAWDSSSSGGYLDIDPLDGEDLMGCLNFFQSIVAVKENRLHRINDFPGDSTFVVKPLMANTGSIAYRSILNTGALISFISKEGWNSLSATDQYGDITKGADLSMKFRADAVAYADANAFAEYNQQDKQLWLTLCYNSELNVPWIYVINLETGGQLSQYQFAFGHSCYKFVNGEMLIGGSDGHLYKLYPDEVNYFDNGVAYTTDTFVRGVMTDWGAPFHRKHNKKIYPHLYGKGSATATLNIYTDQDYSTAKLTESLVTTGGDTLIYSDQTTKIYADTEKIGKEYIAGSTAPLDRKFNYKEVCFELTSITGPLGAEFHGIDLTGAIIGGHQVT